MVRRQSPFGDRHSSQRRFPPFEDGEVPKAWLAKPRGRPVARRLHQRHPRLQPRHQHDELYAQPDQAQAAAHP